MESPKSPAPMTPLWLWAATSIHCPDSRGNDNASGIAVQLVIAELLADVDLFYTFKHVQLGSEELGLSGSRFYVQELSNADLENARLMLNFDALCTGSGVAILRDGVFTNLINEEVNEVGVPFVMVLGGDPSRNHTALDTRSGYR